MCVCVCLSVCLSVYVCICVSVELLNIFVSRINCRYGGFLSLYWGKIDSPTDFQAHLHFIQEVYLSKFIKIYYKLYHCVEEDTITTIQYDNCYYDTQRLDNHFNMALLVITALYTYINNDYYKYIVNRQPFREYNDVFGENKKLIIKHLIGVFKVK